MKARFTMLAIPLMVGAAFAQSTSSQAQTEPQASARPAEMKTMTYKGVLVDLSCGSPQTTAAETPDAATSANRSAGDTANCAVTSNSSTFGLKMDNGQVVRFDLVGNQRAQDELKNNKKWNTSVSASKPIQVKISGVLQGDKLIVSSIH